MPVGPVHHRGDAEAAIEAVGHLRTNWLRSDALWVFWIVMSRLKVSLPSLKESLSFSARFGFSDVFYRSLQQ
jgi:hypothetical protein